MSPVGSPLACDGWGAASNTAGAQGPIPHQEGIASNSSGIDHSPRAGFGFDLNLSQGEADLGRTMNPYFPGSSYPPFRGERIR